MRGPAGIYNLIQPEMANQLLERKLNHIQSTGAAIVATANPGCLLQHGRINANSRAFLGKRASRLKESYVKDQGGQKARGVAAGMGSRAGGIGRRGQLGFGMRVAN